MFRRTVVASFVIMAGIVALLGTANATPLEDAVKAYNTAAPALEVEWSRWCTIHAAAFNDYKNMMDSFFSSLAEDDATLADSYYRDYLASQNNLVNISGPAVESGYTNLTTSLTNLALLLDDALEADQLSKTEVAYSTGKSLFVLQKQPFPFWNDPSWPDINEWMEFTFPELAVGSPQTCPAFAGDGLDGLEVFLQAATDPESWIEFGEWLYEHYDDADEINAARAGDFDSMCLACLATAQLYKDYHRNWLYQRGYTEEEVDRWCEFYADDECHRSGLDAHEKALAIRECVRRKLVDDLQKVVDAIEDYINSAYWMELPREIPTELLRDS
jgi:hypothetical protein